MRSTRHIWDLLNIVFGAISAAVPIFGFAPIVDLINYLHASRARPSARLSKLS